MKSEQFNKIKTVNLQNNKIDDISVIKEAKLDKLKELNLGNNCFKDLMIFENVKFNSLQKIWLEGVNLASNKNRDIIKQLQNQAISVII